MKELIDPTTGEAASEERKTIIIQDYLWKKFTITKKKKQVKYPRSMLPTKATVDYLGTNADLKKTTGYDYIPYEALKYEEFRRIIHRDLTEMLIKNTYTNPYFEAKLTLFNKNKKGKIPNTDQLRLIACTCIC